MRRKDWHPCRKLRLGLDKGFAHAYLSQCDEEFGVWAFGRAFCKGYSGCGSGVPKIPIAKGAKTTLLLSDCGADFGAKKPLAGASKNLSG